MENTVKLHCVIKATPEKVFRAFSDPQAYASWLPPYGFIATIHQMDFKEGGEYRMSFTNFTTGNSHSFGGTFLEIKENELIKNTDQFEDQNLKGEMITTISLKVASVGCEITCVQENIPDLIPLDACYLGWQESLEKLIKLVEPNIPD